MKVLLINPDSAVPEGYSNPPLGLAYLAGTLEQHKTEVKIVDGYLVGKEGIEKEVREYEPDLVGITCYTPGRGAVLDIANWVKHYREDITTVLGGPHPTIMWKQIMDSYRQVDICVLGEGEQTLLEIALGRPLAEIAGIAWRQGGMVMRNPARQYVENLDLIPFPAWHLLALRQYPRGGYGVFNGVDLAAEPRIPVVFTRGCPAHCNFCSTWWIWRGHRCRSASNMVDELELLNKEYGIRHFVFEDDAFSADMEAAKKLCREIVDRRLRIAWFATTRVDCVDSELLCAMRQAGCYEVSYGVESGSARVLELMRKRTTVQQAKDAIKLTKEAGLRATALLIIGNVGETAESINETVDFLNEANPDNIGTVGGLWIFPGTALYQKAKREGLIDDTFWLTDEPTLVYHGEHTRKDLNAYLRAVQFRKKLGTTGYWVAYSKQLLWRLATKPYRMLKDRGAT